MPQVLSGLQLATGTFGPLAIFYGSGAPSSSSDPNVLNAAQGSLYLRLDGGAGSTLYVRETATTWTAK